MVEACDAGHTSLHTRFREQLPDPEKLLSFHIEADHGPYVTPSRCQQPNGSVSHLTAGQQAQATLSGLQRQPTGCHQCGATSSAITLPVHHSIPPIHLPPEICGKGRLISPEPPLTTGGQVEAGCLQNALCPLALHYSELPLFAPCCTHFD